MWFNWFILSENMRRLLREDWPSPAVSVTEDVIVSEEALNRGHLNV